MNWVVSLALGVMEPPKWSFSFKEEPIPQEDSTVEEIQLPFLRTASSFTWRVIYQS